METKILNKAQLSSWVSQLLGEFQDRQLILLKGDLGAGKTEFVKKLLEAMGSQEASSPTYGLIHEYIIPQSPPIFHVDLYRIQDGEDLESSGFWDLFSMASALILVEWADRLPKDQFPLHWPTLEIHITPTPENSSRQYTCRSHKV